MLSSVLSENCHACFLPFFLLILYATYQNGGMGKTTIDANEAAAWIAYRLSEVIAIYPITPSSPMGEWADAWSAMKEPNIWGHVPSVVEMQSEGGAAGAVHGALQTGTLATTFTASQGLLLMIPNMYKIAGELTPCVMHVAARSVAAQGLSIFGDHSDVMAVRQTGFALLCSGSVQEAHDLALIAHASSLRSRIPFLHFFDGFRTSHEVMNIDIVSDQDIYSMIQDKDIFAHYERALSPDHPVMRGTAQNPDVYFQARESVNRFYLDLPGIVQEQMREFEKITGRKYDLFEYRGHPEAERVIILMGSGAEAADETVEAMIERGEKVGLLRVRLYRPFAPDFLLQAIPAKANRFAVLDRCKEPGSAGEPLYQDVLTAFHEAGRSAIVVGGRYGLSSKEFTPAMVHAVFQNLAESKPKNHFTVGIQDDVTNTSLYVDTTFYTEHRETFRGVFFGLGSDGTVSANKNSIKIIGEETDFNAQGFFVYDSKKSGSITISHLRFGKQTIRSTYLITRANFVACHQFNFLEKYDVVGVAEEGAVFLLNSPYEGPELFSRIPVEVQQQMIHKRLRLFGINAGLVAKQAGMGNMINTVMQTCFFAISGVLPREEAIEKIKDSIRKAFGKRGEEVVRKNFEAVDRTLASLKEIPLPRTPVGHLHLRPVVPDTAPEFVQNVTGPMIAGRGDDLPVSRLPVDGTYPTGTTKFEKRNIASEIPVWDPAVCIQCGKCALVCPHGVIRIKSFDPSGVEKAPNDFLRMPFVGGAEGELYTIQVSPDDCTGCTLCVEICPAKNKSISGRKALNMAAIEEVREVAEKSWNYFLTIPESNRLSVKANSVKGSQFLQPLFEFSGACAGCGETPYIKLVTQLFGDRMIIANATGCSSIYGGNLPTTPYTKNEEGRGPAWSNSLFEDNAEFGLGMRLSVDQKTEEARRLLNSMADLLGDELTGSILAADQHDEAGIFEQRARIELLRQRLSSFASPAARRLLMLADYLAKKSVWIIGGDGWAYDIGYGGLDHVLSSGRDVNILILDTEVYSNTGGQMSKSTPIGAVAKFASAGKSLPKKDMGLLAMSYGNVYVARIAMGANDTHTIKAILEAEKYPGPSLLIAYSHCIAHGYDLKYGMQQQKRAVQSGHWNLFRYNPEAMDRDENPLTLDSHGPQIPLKDYLYQENRFKMLTKMDPERARSLLHDAQEHVYRSWSYYENRMEFHAPRHDSSSEKIEEKGEQ